MKKFFSLVLALVMALSLTTVAWAGSTDSCTGTCTHEAKIGATHYDTLAEAVAAADAAGGGTVELLASVAITADTTINPTNAVTIDAKGIVDAIIVEGTLTLGENVTVTSTNGAIFWVKEGGKLVIDGATVTSTGRDANFYITAFVDAGGAMTVNSGSVSSTKTGAIKVNGGTLTVSGGAVYNSATETYLTVGVPVAVEVVAGGTVTVSGDANVYSTTSTALAVNNASATISGNGEVKTTCDNPAYCAAYATAGGVITVTGGKVDAAAGYGLVAAAGGEVTVAGGKVDGVKAHEAASAKATITGGTVTGNVSAANDATITITGGTFTDDVSDYVADGKQLLANGTVVTTPAASATDPVLYVWDKAATDWATYYIATGADLDDLKQDASDNCLPCYLIDGEYFVETAEAAATYKLVYGAKTVYLAPVPASKVCYSDKASVLTVVAKTDAECGDYWVADATYDEDDVYYISYDKKGDIDGIWVKAKNGSEQILVNGKIVDADVAGYVDFMFHEWAGHDIVNYQYTTVKCENCDKVAKLYATATAAGKKAQPVGNGIAGYITYADYTDFGANAPVVDTKVESAETFDAGIAMYVGMSVMAAAGSAVVIGKKKD